MLLNILGFIVPGGQTLGRRGGVPDQDKRFRVYIAQPLKTRVAVSQHQKTRVRIVQPPKTSVIISGKKVRVKV